MLGNVSDALASLEMVQTEIENSETVGGLAYDLTESQMTKVKDDLRETMDKLESLYDTLEEAIQ